MDYIVRRLTPTECARLQGFPDRWCSDLDDPNPSNEDIAEWREIFRTHSLIVNGKETVKSDNQIRKFLRHPHSDAAEYKMWGNGIALPCALYVLAGIEWWERVKDDFDGTSTLDEQTSEIQITFDIGG